MQDLSENHFQLSGASWVNIKVIINLYYYLDLGTVIFIQVQNIKI